MEGGSRGRSHWTGRVRTLLSTLVLLWFLTALTVPFVSLGDEAVSPEISSRGTAFDIIFPGPGDDTSFNLTVENERRVSSIQASLEGFQSGPQVESREFTYSPNGSHLMYWGSDVSVPGDDPGTINDTPVIGQDLNNLTASDDIYISHKQIMDNATPDNTYLYNRFKIKVEPAANADTDITMNISTLRVVWEGYAHDDLNVTQDVSMLLIWNYKLFQWDNLGNASGMDNTTDSQIDGFVDRNNKNPAESYLGSDSFVHIMLMGPLYNLSKGTSLFTIATDYIMLNATWDTFSFPHDIEMDIGNDGSLDWFHSGVLDGTVQEINDDQTIIDGLQTLIDGGWPGVEPGPGNFTVPVRFASSTAGGLTVLGFKIGYAPPGQPIFEPFPSNLSFPEDENGTGLLDLRDHVTDEFGVENLTFSVANVSDPVNVTAFIDPSMKGLVFGPAPDWNGVFELWVTAENRHGMVATSPAITVTVLPVNDIPVLAPMKNLTVNEGERVTFQIEATDIDGDALKYSTNTQLFDVDPLTGQVDFVPDEDDDGVHVVDVKVWDLEYTVSGSFVLTVNEVDSPPVFVDPPTEVKAFEDSVVDIDVNATDAEGDAIVYSISPDDLQIDPLTGEIHFEPKANDVGIHQINVTATAGDLSTTIEFQFIVIEVNDEPVILGLEVTDATGDQNLSDDGPVRFNAKIQDEEGPKGHTYQWSLEDGSVLSDRISFETQLAAGHYSILFTIVDGEHSVSMTIEIEVAEVVPPPPPRPPVIDPPAGPVISTPQAATITVVATVAVVGAVVVGTEVGKFAFFFFLAPLFSRIKKEKALDSFTRGKIYGAILTDPGISYNLLRGITGVGNGNLAHHLKVLERTGFISIRRDGLYKRFYPMEIKVPKKHKVLINIQRSIINALIERPGITQTEVAEIISVRRQVVNYNMKKLEKLDLVRVERTGNVVRCFANQEEILESGIMLDEKVLGPPKGEAEAFDGL